MLKATFLTEMKMNFTMRYKMKNVDLIKKMIVWLPAGSVISLGLFRGDLEITLIGLSLLITVHQLNQLDKKLDNSCWY